MNPHPCLRRLSRSLPGPAALFSLALALAVACPAQAGQQPDHARPPAAGIAGSAPSPAAPVAGPAAHVETEMQPGDYVWTPEAAPPGQVVVVVSLPGQRAHVYRNGIRIGMSTISSGKPGHETPTGVFPILQKREEHYSNLYDGAPMPYMQRLTWDGIALHAGRIPGYPASHGCIRLPKEFAKRLFAATERGVTVVVADEASHGPSVVWPSEQAPVDAYSGLELGRSHDATAAGRGPAIGNTMATLD